MGIMYKGIKLTRREALEKDRGFASIVAEINRDTKENNYSIDDIVYPYFYEKRRCKDGQNYGEWGWSKFLEGARKIAGGQYYAVTRRLLQTLDFKWLFEGEVDFDQLDKLLDTGDLTKEGDNNE